ncbi:MAG: DUF4469 domain-containing protein [Treponema sp.]|jgi:hypothetical protein|nr:DUF4469 domain-containing protein [Treponema sp.]
MSAIHARLLIIVPALPAGTYRLEVTTQYATSGGKLLKSPRTAVFDRLLTVASSRPVASAAAERLRALQQGACKCCNRALAGG